MIKKAGSRSDNSGTGRAGKSVSAIGKKEVVDYSGTAEPMLPVSEASATQLKPGPAPSNLAIFSSEKVSVLELQHHVASVGVVITKPAYFGFMWWEGSDECRINGELARRTVIYSQGPQDGFHAAGGVRRTTGITVRRDILIETMAALRGVDPEDVFLGQTKLELSPGAAHRFRTGVDLHLRKAIRSIKGDLSHEGKADPSEAFFGLLVEAYLRSRPDLQRNDRPLHPVQIVRKSEERFFASRDAPVSLADLCAAARVSQATLYRAFHTVCGEPPLAYFHKRRLTDARRALIRSHAYRGAVKHVALTNGLTELGRFAVEYRHLFGESPSATLNRTLSL